MKKAITLMLCLCMLASNAYAHCDSTQVIQKKPDTFHSRPLISSTTYHSPRVRHHRSNLWLIVPVAFVGVAGYVIGKDSHSDRTTYITPTCPVCPKDDGCNKRH